MRQRSNWLYLFCLLVAFTPLPALAANPHATPGLDPSALTGLAAMGYMGYQSIKARCNKR